MPAGDYHAHGRVDDATGRWFPNRALPMERITQDLNRFERQLNQELARFEGQPNTPETRVQIAAQATDMAARWRANTDGFGVVGTAPLPLVEIKERVTLGSWMRRWGITLVQAGRTCGKTTASCLSFIFFLGQLKKRQEHREAVAELERLRQLDLDTQPDAQPYTAVDTALWTTVWTGPETRARSPEEMAVIAALNSIVYVPLVVASRDTNDERLGVESDWLKSMSPRFIAILAAGDILQYHMYNIRMSDASMRRNGAPVKVWSTVEHQYV